MSLQDLTKEELDEKFEMFLFNMDDNLEEFIERLDKKGYHLDYSEKSLNTLEQFIINEKIGWDDDDVNKAGMYFGEYIRKKYNGKWRCSLEDKDNIYYGMPVIFGYTEPKDLEISPIDDVQTLIVRPRKNHFKIIIDNDINPEEIDWTGFPDEEEDLSKEDPKPNKPRGGWSVFD